MGPLGRISSLDKGHKVYANILQRINQQNQHTCANGATKCNRKSEHMGAEAFMAY